MEQWPGMMLPWVLIAIVGVVLPFLTDSSTRRGDREETLVSRRRGSSPLWFVWWWAVGNLGVFSLWLVAKTNYYLPCLPGMALLIGAAWVWLAQQARSRQRGAGAARAILQAQWVLLFVAAAVAPIVTRSYLPRAIWPWSVAIAATLAASVVASARIWRRGGDAISLAPMTTACALAFLICYGVIAPVQNISRGHRALAQTLLHVVPPEVRSVRIFNEIDEGLGYYLGGMNLIPVPGSQPRYSTAFDLVDAYRTRPASSITLEDLDASRQIHEQHALLEWLEHGDPSTPYLLIRSNLYDRLADEMSKRMTPLFRESGLSRNELVLLHVDNRGPVALTPDAVRR